MLNLDILTRHKALMSEIMLILDILTKPKALISEIMLILDILTKPKALISEIMLVLDILTKHKAMLTVWLGKLYTIFLYTIFLFLIVCRNMAGLLILLKSELIKPLRSPNLNPLDFLYLGLYER